MYSFPYPNPHYPGFDPNVSPLIPLQFAPPLNNFGNTPEIARFNPYHMLQPFPSYSSNPYSLPTNQFPINFNWNAFVPNELGSGSYAYQNLSNNLYIPSFYPQKEKDDRSTNNNYTISQISSFDLNNNRNNVDSVSASSEAEIINFVNQNKQLNNETDILKINEKTENENEEEHKIDYDADIELKKNEKEADELIEIDTSQWNDKFNSKEEALQYFNQKGFEFGVQYKFSSVKSDLIKLEDGGKIFEEKKICFFTLLCQQHSRAFEAITSNKQRQLSGCNAKINFIMEKTSTKVKESKLGVSYIKST